MYVFRANAHTAKGKAISNLFPRSPAERAHDAEEYAHACPINYKDTNHLHARLIKGSSAHLHRDFPPIRVLRFHLQAQRANLCDCQEI